MLFDKFGVYRQWDLAQVNAGFWRGNKVITNREEVSPLFIVLEDLLGMPGNPIDQGRKAVGDFGAELGSD